MHFTRTLFIAALGYMSLTGAVPARAQQPAPQPAPQPAQQQKKVKDQAEYDLFNGVLKAPDANKKLELLNTWKDKYPTSDFKDDRLIHYVQTYAQLGKFPDAIGAAKELLALDAKNITALFYINNLTPVAYPANAPADALDTAEKAANGLINAEQPAAAKPEDWQKAKKDLDAAAHKTLGWIAWQRKNLDVAEQEFAKTIEINPQQGEVSYWLGSALLATRKPDKQAAGLYSIARAVVVEPAQGGLNDEVRKRVDAYLIKTYTALHGSDEGLAQMKDAAKAQPLAPAGFEIKSKGELDAAKDEQDKKANPSLALWKTLKGELTGANGTAFFDSNMKNANVPGGAGGVHFLSGKVVAAKPAVAAKELIIAVSDATTPEVTLKLENPAKGKVVIGSDVNFEGVPVEFAKNPFMVTFDQGKVSGLKTEAAPAPVSKKSGAKKK